MNNERDSIERAVLGAMMMGFLSIGSVLVDEFRGDFHREVFEAIGRAWVSCGRCDPIVVGVELARYPEVHSALLDMVESTADNPNTTELLERFRARGGGL